MSENSASSTGVLLVGFGGPSSIEAVKPFMCELMGHEPADSVVDEVCMRYLAIGGSSPLPEIAGNMASALADELTKRTGREVPVVVGMRYSEPFIDDAVAELVARGVERIVLVALSPFESKVTHGAYREAISQALLGHPGVEVVEAPLIGTLDAFAEIVAASAVAALGELESTAGALVVFSAHSLPYSDLVEDDPYVAGLREMIDRVCEYGSFDHGRDDEGEPLLPGIKTYGSVGGTGQPWVLAYQSKGKRGGEWLGPDVDDVIAAAHEGGAKAIVAVPDGFVTDHLETLYDLDISAAGRAYDLDLDYARGPVANDHEHLIAGLAQAVEPLL